MASEQKRKQEIITLAVVFAGVLVVTALAVYYLGNGRQTTPATTRQTEAPAPTIDVPAGQATPAPRADAHEDSFIDRMFGIQEGGRAQAKSLRSPNADSVGHCRGGVDDRRRR
jgi:hypothetical protein